MQERELNDLLNYFCPKVIALYVQDRPDLVCSLGLLVDTCGIKFFGKYHSKKKHYIVGCLTEIFRKTNKILTNSDTRTYPLKICACKLISALAIQLQGAADLVIAYYGADVVKALETASKDRIAKV